MVYNFLGVVVVIIRIIKKIFDELTSFEDYACGFVVGDIKEGETLASWCVFNIIDDDYVKAFGCFKICP